MSKPNDFWGTANKSFSAKERKAFNKWKTDLCLAGYAVSDCFPSDPNSRTICGDVRSRIKELMEIICDVPIMKGKGI